MVLQRATLEEYDSIIAFYAQNTGWTDFYFFELNQF